MAIKISGTTVIDDSRNLTNIGTATISGNVQLLEELQATAYIETHKNLSGDTSVIVDCDEANSFEFVVIGNMTVTFDYSGINLTSNDSYAFIIRVIATFGPYTITWPSSVDWAGGTAPDAPELGDTDVYVFYTTNGGSTWYGFQAGDAMA